jgi:hypothetical protein
MLQSSFGEVLARLWPSGDAKIRRLRAGIAAAAPAVFAKYGITTQLGAGVITALMAIGGGVGAAYSDYLPATRGYAKDIARIKTDSALQVATARIGNLQRESGETSPLITGPPPIGNGSNIPAQGTRSANTTVFAASTGVLTANDCVKVNASGNLVDAGATCGANANTPYVQDFLNGAGFTAGTTTALTLMNSPSAAQLLSITFDGVVQSHNTWSLAGAVVTFNAAIPANTQVVEAHWYAPSTTAGVGNLNAVSSALNLLGERGIDITTTAPTTNTPAINPFIYNPVTAAPYNARCDGSDDSAALQAAIDNLPAFGGFLDLPYDGSTCAHASTLNWKAKRNIWIRGAGSFSSNTLPSTLLYTGAGARGHDVRDAVGIKFSGVLLAFNNPAFAGIFIDAGGQTPGTSVSGAFGIFNSEVTAFGAAQVTPHVTCVNLGQAIEFNIEESIFTLCNPAIAGGTAANPGQSTTGLIKHNQFWLSPDGGFPPISGCGVSWHLISNIFEPNVAGKAAAMQTFNMDICTGGVFSANWYGDVTVAGGTWFPNLTAKGLTVTGDVMGSSGGSNGGYYLVGGSGYKFEGGYYSGLSFAFQCDVTSKPTGTRWETNTFLVVTSPVSQSQNCLDSDALNNTPNIVLVLPSWVPIYTPSSGSIPATTVDATYKQSGNMTEYFLNATFGTVSGTGSLTIGGLPVRPGVNCPVHGIDGTSSQTLTGMIPAGGSGFQIFKASNPASQPAVATGSIISLHARCPTG